MLAESLDELVESLGSVDNDEIEWENVRRTTVLIHQTFLYEYEGPVSELRQRLMVVPRDDHGHQRLVTHRLRVTGSQLDSERSYDSFGNVVLDLRLPEVVGRVEFATWAVVERDQLLNRPEHPNAVGVDRRFAEPSRLTAPSAALGAVAADANASGARDVELAMLLGRRVHDHFTYALGSTGVETTAAEAWAGGRGVCQDYAHCLLSLCRLCGIPSRYVSGHLLGEGGTHAWVEVLVEDGSGIVSAIAVDPTHDRRVGPRYVTIAVGRDYHDVAPTSGTFRGPLPGRLTTQKRAAVIGVEYLEPGRRDRLSRG